MKLIITILCTLLLFFSLPAKAQSDSVFMTTIVPYGGLGLVQKEVFVPEKFKSAFGTARTLNVPKNWSVQVYYIGNLSKPRVLEMSPAGILHVIDYKTNGAIYALPDENKDQVADTLLPIVTGVNAHDFKFYQNRIYVAEETRILECSDINNDGFYETKTVYIDSIGLRSNNPTGGHRSRTLVIDSVRQKIYVSIGSSCNVCRDTDKAIIEQYNINGTQRKVFATGIRNAVGMSIDPYTGKLWANNNGSDKQGNDIPPEWMDEIREDGFYGFPFAYGNKNWFNLNTHPDYTQLKPITQIDSQLVAKMVQPKALFQAHSAPMEMEFMRTDYSTLADLGIMMALRGSWNRNPATGYKLVYFARFSNPETPTVADFATGFLTDSITGTFWGRPVGLASKIENNGQTTSLYMSSDDGKRCIIKFTLQQSSSINETETTNIKTYPIPFQNEIHWQLNGLTIDKVTLIDLQGRTIPCLQTSTKESVIIPDIENGIYFLVLQSGNKVYTQKVLRQQ
jgi:glucose/arabinose dehydrogenase